MHDISPAHIGHTLKYLGNTRYENVDIFLDHAARPHHLYVVGKTGTGKSTFLEGLMDHDIQTHTGFCFIDPHGKSAKAMLDRIPPERVGDVIYFDAADAEYPIAFNPLDRIREQDRHLAVDGIISSLKHIFKDSWGEGRMEYLATNTIAALIDAHDATLLGVRRMLTDPEYRKYVKQFIVNHEVRTFWYEEFPHWPETYRREAIPPILNKVCQLFLNPLLVNIFGQTTTALNFEEIMNTGKILIVNLAKGRMGRRASNLLGSTLITHLYLTALRRESIPEHERTQYHLYVDEFTNFTIEEELFSEVRKYKIGLTVAHQYTAQMKESVRCAVFGTVGTLISFRVGEGDAEHLDREMPHTPEDKGEFYLRLPDLPNFYARVKMLIEGYQSAPFILITRKPSEVSLRSGETIIHASRTRYGRPLSEVEREINERWYPTSKEFLVKFDS